MARASIATLEMSITNVGPLTGAQVFLKTLKNNKQDERGEQAKSMAEEEGIYFY